VSYVDVKADGDQTGNDFGFTEQTAFGLEPNEGRGLRNTNNNNFGQDTLRRRHRTRRIRALRSVLRAAAFPWRWLDRTVWSFPADGHNSSHDRGHDL
jgi:hypothetical protein